MRNPIGRGLRLERLLSFVWVALAVLALSFAIAWPLWALATKARAAFTAMSLGLAALALLYLVARRITRCVSRRATRRIQNRTTRREGEHSARELPGERP